MAAFLDHDQHVDRTVRQLADLYADHARSVTPVQKVANRATAALAKPASLTVTCLIILTWMSGNYVAAYLGSSAFERFPFPDLAFVATVVALLIALLILTAQRHQDDLAEKRATLTLEIALLSEMKIAKIIALLEEQRRDNPMLVSRVDLEADAMAAATNPRNVLDAITSLDAA